MIINIIKIGINLMIISLIGATILAVTNFMTAPAIEKVEKMAKLKARQSVLPMAIEFKEIKGKEGYFKGLDYEGKVIGYVITCLAEGYGGGFWVMVGVDKEFKVMQINILNNKETPGLGNKIEEDKFRNQYKDKGIENLEVLKVPTQDKIQAITGATISSKAVTEAVKKGLEELKRIVSQKELKISPISPIKH